MLWRCWSYTQNPHHGPVGGRNEPLYDRLLAKVKRTIKPIELVGSAGDVCFWHNRLVVSTIAWQTTP